MLGDRRRDGLGGGLDLGAAFDDAEDVASFKAAVKAAYDAPAFAANLLFGARSRQLLFGGTPAAARETLSGTLIGAELAAGVTQARCGGRELRPCSERRLVVRPRALELFQPLQSEPERLVNVGIVGVDAERRLKISHGRGRIAEATEHASKQKARRDR